MTLNAMSSEQLVQKQYLGLLNDAERQQVITRQDQGDNWLLLAALVAVDEHRWAQGIELLRQYLSQNPFSVHRLRARALLTQIQAFQQDPALGDFLLLLQMRQRDQVDLMYHAIGRMQASYPHSVLTEKAQLVAAHAALELENNLPVAIERYRSLTERAKEDEHRFAAYLGLVMSYHRQGRLGEAMQVAEQFEAQLEPGWFGGDDLQRRVWRQRLQSATALLNQEAPVKRPMIWGTGARLDVDLPVGSGQNYQPLWRHAPVQAGVLQGVTLWITRHSDWRWLQPDLLKLAVQKGYTPMISLWYFGDEISPEFVTEHWDAYRTMIRQRLIPLLKDLPEAYLLLEPEFNKNGIERWPEWGRRMSEVIGEIKRALPGIKVGMVLGDWDPIGQFASYESAAPAIEASDFVGTMLMIAGYTEAIHFDADWSPWIRAQRLALQLRQRFNKPWMLAYVAIASEPQWQRRQALELEKLEQYLPALKQYGLFAINWFSLVDDPGQQGWFADAEQSFGLLDRNFEPKPAAQTWHRLASTDPNVVPELIQWRFEPTAQGIAISAQLSHRTRWQLTLTDGLREWQYQGAATHIDLNWNGYGPQGQRPIAVSFTWSSGRRDEVTEWVFQPSQGQQVLSQSKVLRQWQSTLFDLPSRPADLAVVQLYLSELEPIDDQLFVGLQDAGGATRMVRAAPYLQRVAGGYVLELPISDLAPGWRRYQSGAGFEWRSEPKGRVTLNLQNQSSHPVRFRADKLIWY
ncbi:hypothetical protein GCM10023333_42980 [Ferrimonas pelagia]|uniref:Tetratricopeptide repeat protein n=2 Tax=Ferrimonas pelagia TaxID=1177826 RepID=A0ABP9FJM2_9GAMM